MSAKPSNWPNDVLFLASPSASRSLSLEQKQRYCTVPLAAPSEAQQPSRTVKIQRITNASHPACGQYGLFAAKKIPAKAWLIDYHGLVHLDSESDPSSDYDLSLDRSDGVSIDAAKAGNAARMVNDYRGIQERPNVEFQLRSGCVNGVEVVRMAIYSLSEISKGSELCISYGKGFWAGRKQ